MIPLDHLVPQHLQRAPQELLDPQVPYMFLQEQHTRTRKLAEAVTSTTPPNTKVEHLVITSFDHQQTLSQQGSY